MSLYAVCSAKASPGVTTLATALAMTWHRPAVIADLDVSGGDLAVRYRDDEGRPLQPERGLLSLGAAVRRGADQGGLADHLQRIAAGPEVLVGVARPEQVVGLGASWQHLAQALATTPDSDVIADCGRVLPTSAALPALVAARGVLVLARPSVEELFHLRERLTGLVQELHARQSRVRVAVALVTDERDRSSVGDVQRLLDAAHLKVTVVGQVAYDPKAAYRLRYSLESPPSKSMLLRSVAALGESMRELATSTPTYA